jgi:hypothetical protein
LCEALDCDISDSVLQGLAASDEKVIFFGMAEQEGGADAASQLALIDNGFLRLVFV